MFFYRFLAAAGLIGLISASAYASDYPGHVVSTSLVYDGDSDGRITKAEFDHRMGTYFYWLDGDGDGVVVHAEIDAWVWARDCLPYLKGITAGLSSEFNKMAGGKTVFSGNNVRRYKQCYAYRTAIQRALGKKKIAYLESEARRMKKRWDLNRDGKVTRTEFNAVALVSFLSQERDGDGVITRQDHQIADR